MELENYAKEMGLSLAEAALDLLTQFYEAAGFADVYEKELAHLSPTEIDKLFKETFFCDKA